MMENESLDLGERGDATVVNPDFVEYMKTAILRKLKDGKSRTADNYLSSMNKFCVFLHDRDDNFRLSDLTSAVINDYLQWLIQTETLAEGTVDFYLRTLKAMYNQGLKEYHIRLMSGSPFQGTTIKVPATRKRALPDDLFDRLIALDLSDQPNLLTALHLALFLFYARGMNFIDAFNLTEENIVDNYIVYNRSKTQVSLQVKITPEIKRLFKVYRKKDCPWILPFLHEKMKGQGEVTPQSSLRRMNTYLKAIGEMLGLPHVLTTYVMRHSWASMMFEAGSELGVISQSLGHTSMHTTEIYLSNLSVGKIDRAADDMLNTFIRKKKYYRKELHAELTKKKDIKEGNEVLDNHLDTQSYDVDQVKIESEKVPQPKTQKGRYLSKLQAAISSVASIIRRSLSFEK